jgi:hypothetical protein
MEEETEVQTGFSIQSENLGWIPRYLALCQVLEIQRRIRLSPNLQEANSLADECAIYIQTFWCSGKRA